MTTLPELPPVPDEIVVDEDADGGAMYGQDEDALRAWAIAYADLAVRSAAAAIRNATLEEAAQILDYAARASNRYSPVSEHGFAYQSAAECVRALKSTPSSSLPTTSKQFSVQDGQCTDPAGGACLTCGTRPGLPCPKASALKSK